MDLVASAKRVVITMTHTNKKGAPKLLKKCTLPLTSQQCVDRVITEMGVFDFDKRRMILRETAPGLTVDDIRKVTEAQFDVADKLEVM